MAYIQILAIVLCSCFVQDAFSVVNDRKMTSAPANGATASRFTSTDDRRQSIPIQRMVSRKPTAIQAPPPPPPTTKYPNLTTVTKMFWDTFEDINRDSMNGKLNMRSARNTMSNILGNKQFWSSLTAAVKKDAKITGDPQLANKKIRFCDAITDAMTRLNGSLGFKDVANNVYDTVSGVRLDVDTGALQSIVEMVNDGKVVEDLDTLTNTVNDFDFNPSIVTEGFDLVRYALNTAGKINLGGLLTRRFVSFTSKLRK